MNFKTKWKIENFVSNNKEELIKELKNSQYNLPAKIITFTLCNPIPYLYLLSYSWGFWFGNMISLTSSNGGTGKIILLSFSFFLLAGFTSLNLKSLWKMIKNPSRFFKKIYYWLLTEQKLSLNTFRMLKDVIDEEELINLIKENGKLTYKDIDLTENSIYCYFYNKKIEKKNKRKIEKKENKEKIIQLKRETELLNKEKEKKDNSEKIENFVKSLYKEKED